MTPAGSYYNKEKERTTSQDEPVIIFVGGQSGAGKSRNGQIEFNRLQGNGVRVDADRLREFISQPNGLRLSQETQEEAGRNATELRMLAVQGRRNIIEEGTFRNSEGIELFINTMKKAGYKLELVAVATPAEESLLGIYQRHEKQHKAGSLNPRFVPENFHNDSVHGFQKTLAKSEHLLDVVKVVNRDGDLLYDSKNKQDNKEATAIQALLRGQILPDQKLVELIENWDLIKTLAAKRGAEIDYISDVQKNVDHLSNLKSSRLHEHGLKHLDENISALNADTRYIQHSDEELAKAAYFRGVKEKSDTFKGERTDLEPCDNLMSDRQQLSEFPEIEEIKNIEIRRDLHTKDDLNLSR